MCCSPTSYINGLLLEGASKYIYGPILSAHNLMFLFLVILNAAVASKALEKQDPLCAPHAPVGWRQVVRPLMEHLARDDHEKRLLQRDGHVYEVGVFSGASMTYLWQELKPPKVWGFDSFKGLPETTSRDEWVRDWHQGRVRCNSLPFNGTELLPASTLI